MKIDPDVVDREHGFGIKAGKGPERTGVEETGIDLNGTAGDWPTYRTELVFDCCVEGYAWTEKDRQFLRMIIIPEHESTHAGSDDALTHYFYRKAAEGEPEALLAAVYETSSLLTYGQDGWPQIEEVNELKIARLLAMIADMPSEIDAAVRFDVWEAALNADWLHWSERDGEILAGALRRLSENDAAHLSSVACAVERAIEVKKKILKEKTDYNKEVVETIKEISLEGYDFIRDNYPKLLMLYNSLFMLSIAEQEVGRLISLSRRS